VGTKVDLVINYWARMRIIKNSMEKVEIPVTGSYRASRPHGTGSVARYIGVLSINAGF